MLKIIRTAALAASLALIPGAALVQHSAGVASASSVSARAQNGVHLDRTGLQDSRAVSRPATTPAPDAREALHESTHTRDPSLAPGQTWRDYQAWLSRSPAHRGEVAAFRARLAAEGVEHVVPVWQLIRTSSSWRQCASEPFEVAPADKWDHIVRTLKFVRDEVVPAIGPVEALSAYRNEQLNRCSAGAPRSAHRHFHALDLTPVRAEVTRATMIRTVCSAHGQRGRDYDTGLGFYSGLRFHVDSSGYRRWGPNGRGATSPCIA
ncbi:D-Ala-D-Ala carboxypeptidase family metallohydrolase [Sphingosinicella terrae]|uniref:D-Ala-D-Ala carboxypeptidase family metallohydrolase n=1 Tax=Sphingosinicella terrae TaxID=2172047 RepID=UPI000E0D9752|nr:D-Ala-D-Ala carboxypeptidase family metallohydrolase [Sphingosinicella terrae]